MERPPRVRYPQEITDGELCPARWRCCSSEYAQCVGASYESTAVGDMMGDRTGRWTGRSVTEITPDLIPQPDWPAVSQPLTTTAHYACTALRPA